MTNTPPPPPRRPATGHAVTTTAGGQTRVQSTKGNAEVERNRNGYAVHTRATRSTGR
jgi:hypothetical protein